MCLEFSEVSVERTIRNRGGTRLSVRIVRVTGLLFNSSLGQEHHFIDPKEISPVLVLCSNILPLRTQLSR